MGQATFEKQVLDRLSYLEKGVHIIKNELDLIREKIVDDTLLSEEDKKDIDLALKEEKEGKLLTKKHIFD